MTHRECLDVLLARLEGSNAGDPERFADLETHLTTCSDCWAVVETLYRAVGGDQLPDAERLKSLYGCEPVRDRMHELVRIPAAELFRREPGVARHLAWCEACRNRLATLALVERDVEIAAPSVPDRARAGAAALVGRVVILVQRGLAAFAELDGLVPIGMLDAVAVRGGSSGPAVAEVRLSSQPNVPEVDLRAQPMGDGVVDLEVCVRSDVGDGAILWLRTADLDEPVACCTVRAGEPVVLPAVPPGRYVLELPGTPPSRLAVDVEAAPDGRVRR